MKGELLRLRGQIPRYLSSVAAKENELEALRASTSLEFTRLGDINATLKEQLAHYPLAMEGHMQKIARLQLELESEKREREWAEKSWKDVKAELATETQKTRAAEAKLGTATSTNRNLRASTEGLEKQIEEVTEKLDAAETSVAQLEAKAATLEHELEAEKKRVMTERRLVQDRADENAGIRDQLNEKIEECNRLTAERDEWRAQETSRPNLEDELQEARDKIAALDDQLEKLQFEAEQRRPFDDTPTGYSAPHEEQPFAKTPLSLREELDRSKRIELSSEGSVDEERSLIFEATEDGKDTSGQHVQAQVEMHTVTQVIFTPYEVSAHNPLVCWFHTELNFSILFSVWLILFINRLSRFLRRGFGFPQFSTAVSTGHLDASGPLSTGDLKVPPPPSANDLKLSAPLFSDESKVSAPPSVDDLKLSAPLFADDSKVSATLSADDLKLSVPLFSDDGKVSAPLSFDDLKLSAPLFSDDRKVSALPAASDLDVSVPPSVDDLSPNSMISAENLHSQTGGQPSLDTTKNNSENRPWYRKIISPLPSEVPSVKKTLIGFVFHLLVYLCILGGILAWHERSIWVAANEHSRAFVQQLIHNPHSNQSWLSYVIETLPEHWKHGIDVLIFKYVVEGFGLQAGYALPG